jgi:RND family efflux transporter MFP subunit
MIVVAAGLLIGLPAADAQQKRPLSPIAQNLDANGNGVLERSEARGPADANFDTIDNDKSGTLDGDELFNFFQGGGATPAAAASDGPAAESSGEDQKQPGEKRPLSPIAQNLDSNKNGVLERTEARGPVVANFDTIDKDKSGTLDGDELFEFFQGGSNSGGGGGGGGSGPPANVVVDAVIEEPLSQTVPVLGRMVAGEFGPIAARIGGAVNEMRVDVGDRVKRGTVLAVLDRERLALERDRYKSLVRQQSAKLAGARADLQKVSLDLKRLEGIRKSAAFSQARYDDAIQDVVKQRGEVAETQAELAQAETQLKRASVDLQDSEVRAPYPGVVSEKHTEVGAYLNIGSPVVTLINDLDIEIEADIPGNRLGGLARGTSIRVTLDDKSEHVAIVRAIIPDENPRTRTRPVRFEPKFTDLAKPLATNQTVTVHVPIGIPRTVTTVSKDAIVRRGGNVLVFVVRDGNGQPQPVTLDESVGNRFVVTSGLKAGDRVVVRGNENLRPGQRLRITGDLDAPAAGARAGG